MYIFVPKKGTNFIMRIAVLIPTRNDRPLFEANCLRMIQEQTIKPDIIELVNDEPLNFNSDGSEKPDINNKCDITWRYRTGYDRLRKKNLDAILFMENDDWYRNTYIETMLKGWNEAGRPELFGTNYTIYYHMKLKSYFTMNHSTRSSAMSTLIKPDLNFNWCKDSEPYTDTHLWTMTNLKGATFNPGKHITIGMKHGVGMCGGNSHINRLERYTHHRHSTQDKDQSFLKRNMDEKSFKFYSEYFN